MSLKGVDIASYQKDMDITKIDADFVIIKLTQGDYYVNPYFDKQFKQAESSGKLIGIYHYSNGVTPYSTEVNFLIEKVKPYLKKAIICLDWESNGRTKNSGFNPVFNTANEVNYVYNFMSLFYEKTGIWSFLYTSASVTRLRNWSKVAEVSPLWLAQYANDKLTGYQEKPWRDTKGNGAWNKVSIHQYSPSGTIKGYEQTSTHKLDLDIAYITRDEWISYATGESKTAITKKTVTPNIVAKVFAGEYGTGNTRKMKLAKDGYDYNEVQKKINELAATIEDIRKLKIKTGDYWNLVLSEIS